MAQQTTVTALLAGAGREDPRRVLDRLIPLVYEELREMAHRQLPRAWLGRELAAGAPSPLEA